MENYFITYLDMYNDIKKKNLKTIRSDQKSMLALYLLNKFEVPKTDFINFINSSFMSNFASRFE